MQNLFWVTLRRLFYHDTKMLEMIDNRYRKTDVDISYNDTTNKPQVNGTTLTGNKTSDDLSLQSKTQFTTLPTASAELVGKIYQYIGEDTQTYKNGYFYKCISEEDELGTVTYSWADSVGKAVTSLEELTDTDLDSPTNGQALLFNGEEWVNGDLPTQTTTLEALTDTDIDEPVTGEVLKFDGTSWVNGSLPTPSTTLEALTDTDITTPTDSEILRFNGTDWENSEETQENQTISLADFEQLTPEEKNNGTAYFIPDANVTSNIMVVGNRFDKANIYTDTERMVGSWMGKPLYQKTAQVTLPSVSVQTWTNVGFSLGNNISFAKIIGAEVSSNDPGYGFIPLPYLNMIAVKVADDGNIQIYESSNASWANILYITIQYTKTSDGTISIGTENDYSTDETWIGTWIDGKPLYQKTVYCGGLVNSGYKDTPHEISNIDLSTAHIVGGWGSNTNYSFVLPYVEPNQQNNNIGVLISNTLIRIRTSDDYSSITSSYITLQYTKTEEE